MTSFKELAQATFPPLKITGESTIHVSHYRAANMPLSMDDTQKVMSALIQGNFAGIVYRAAMANFPGMEWMMTTQEFNDLVLVDCHRFLNGKPSVATKKKLTNPKTGNVFHRIALMESKHMVLGFRVWLTESLSEGLNIGFRLRLEDVNMTDTKVAPSIRANAVELVELLEPEMIEINEIPTETNLEFELEACFA